MHRFKHAGVAAILASFAFLAAALQYDPISGAPIVTGPGDDHKAVMISIDERLLLLFERRAGAQNDLYVVASEDDGATWGDAVEVSVGGPDDRLGSLVELGDGSLALFYTSNADGVYRVHRATSSDGTTWVKHGAVDLHQSPASPANPYVIVEDDGRLTMVFQLLSGNLYAAQSSDDGVTWDEEPTQIGPSWAVSPHIIHTGDGRYLLTYHTSTADLTLYAQVSETPYVWEGEPTVISASAASRSGFPIRLFDGTLAVFYGHSEEGAPANIYYRVSEDGTLWDTPVQVTQAEFSETAPSAIRAAGSRAVHLLWSQETGPGDDHDIYFHPSLELRALPTPTWTPSPTATATAPVFMSPTPTPTSTPQMPTLTPSYTPTRTSTPTETLTPTPITPTATPTITPTPTQTPTLIPRLALTPGSYPVRVSAGEPITVTWTLATNRGADLWIEWGTRIAQFDQRYDFPWVPAGIHAFEHVIVAPSWSYLGFRVTAKDDVQSAISWSGQVRVTAHAVYVPMIKR